MKYFEIKTFVDGRHDVFTIVGTSMETDSDQIRIFGINVDGKYLVAAFQSWHYGIERNTEYEKMPGD